MSIIGKQIKKFRMERGLTQEQLGELVGVTTQAVSKWERGGTPDAELLPQLSKVLCVSIDALFANEDDSFVVSLARRISQMPQKEAYRYFFSICWSMLNGLTNDLALMDIEYINSFVNNYTKKSTIGYKGKGYQSYVMQDNGMITTRLSPDLHFMFLMVEPENKINVNLSAPETMRKVFETLADKNILSIIYYMYTRLNTPIDASLISKNTGISIKNVEKYMNILCEINLATRNTLATANGEIKSYTFDMEGGLIPLLCFTDMICKNDLQDFMIAFERTKPLFKP